MCKYRVESFHSRVQHLCKFIATKESGYIRKEFNSQRTGLGPGGTPYDGLYGEAPPERGTFLGIHVYEKVEISLVEVFKRAEKSVTWAWKGPKGI